MMFSEIKDGLVSDLEHCVSRFATMRATLETVDDLDRRGIEGDFVECGVLRGGHMLLSKAYERARSMQKRNYWLFDTFDGMPPPGKHDFKYSGEHASVSREQKGPNWCRATLETVQHNFVSRGLLDDRVTFVKGMVEKTLRDTSNIPDRISFLRLDTDFYESTKIEMEVLYPLLVPGGVLVIDDYGFWRGSKRAVDEYFGSEPKFQVIDSPARMMVKP